VDFVKATGLDALAIAIGTSHGAYKFSSKPTGETLKMERLIDIHKRLPGVHLVMHGSSSVPQDLQDIINKYGGKLKPTWGVPVKKSSSVSRTACARSTWTPTVGWPSPARSAKYSSRSREFDPRSYLKPAREAMKKVVACA